MRATPPHPQWFFMQQRQKRGSGTLGPHPSRGLEPERRADLDLPVLRQERALGELAERLIATVFKTVSSPVMSRY